MKRSLAWLVFWLSLLTCVVISRAPADTLDEVRKRGALVWERSGGGGLRLPARGRPERVTGSRWISRRASRVPQGRASSFRATGQDAGSFARAEGRRRHDGYDGPRSRRDDGGVDPYYVYALQLWRARRRVDPELEDLRKRCGGAKRKIGVLASSSAHGS